MEKVRWWLVDVVKTFPADRPVAKLMARAMVTWADAQLEFNLSSAQKTINSLTADTEFKSWLDAAPNLQKEYFEYKKTFDHEMAQVNKIRNQVAAHIEMHVGESLANLPEESVGVLVECGHPALFSAVPPFPG